MASPIPLPAEVLKLRGSYRKDRHGDRDRIPKAVGAVKAPKHLTGEALACWKRIVPELESLKLIGTIDTDLIVSTCEHWELYRLARKSAKKDPLDKIAGCAVRRFWDAYMLGVKQLGLSPMARGQLRAEKPEAPVDPLAKYTRKRG